MRIVADTNIWISGLLWRGDAWRLLKLAEEGRIEICISYAMLLELEEVLAYERFAPRLESLRETPAQLAAFALHLAVAIDVAGVDVPIVTADPDDDMFLLCAESAQASFVVTADQHLLKMRDWKGVRITTVGQFLEQEFLR